VIEKGKPSMGMLRSYSYPFFPLPPYPMLHSIPITPLSLYPGPYPTPLPRYPFIPEDSLCES
jgi:hypothetical protein